MKVRDLISMLENCDLESEVVFLPTNTLYAHGIKSAKEGANLRACWGNNRKVTALRSEGQVGSVDF